MEASGDPLPDLLFERTGWGESAAAVAVTPDWRAAVRVLVGREPDS